MQADGVRTQLNVAIIAIDEAERLLLAAREQVKEAFAIVRFVGQTSVDTIGAPNLSEMDNMIFRSLEQKIKAREAIMTYASTL